MGLFIPSSRLILIYKVILILGCITLSIGLSGYVYIGSFMRYSGDDYCYGAVLTKYGFWGAQTYSYNNPVPFHGNRYALTLFSSIVGLFKPSINGVLPGLAIGLWILGLFYLFSFLMKKSGFQLWYLEILLISEFIAFITLYAAPDLPESLYWRSGMLPYLAPIILNVYLTGFVMRYKPQTQSSVFLLGSVLLLAFISGGFSETATGLQAGILFLWFIGTLIAHKRVSVFNKDFRAPLAIAIIGTVFAVILLVSSPAIESELKRSGFIEDIFASSLLTLQYAWNFIVDSLRSLPLPHLIVLTFFANLAFIMSTRIEKYDSPKWARITIQAGLVMVAGYFLIACCIAPAAFVRTVKPNPRGLITTRFVMVCVFASLGWLISLAIRPYLNRRKSVRAFIYMSSLLVLVLISLYPLRAARNTYSGALHYQKWARLWDIRDLNIREAGSQGVKNVKVTHLDKVIKWVGELSGDPTNWYNRCAAGYYDVESISATISVWDE